MALLVSIVRTTWQHYATRSHTRIRNKARHNNGAHSIYRPNDLAIMQTQRVIHSLDIFTDEIEERRIIWKNELKSRINSKPSLWITELPDGLVSITFITNCPFRESSKIRTQKELSNGKLKIRLDDDSDVITDVDFYLFNVSFHAIEFYVTLPRLLLFFGCNVAIITGDVISSLHKEFSLGLVVAVV
uniref:Uncharacterized protein n=1 Tax=Strigamia maritima TaxID=126957 RepID=T1JGX5_STRMM